MNEALVEMTGEPFRLRDQGLLESALGNPRARYDYGDEEDIVYLAVSLMFAISRNHPFEQGNKRTAFVAALAFLQINGYDWEGPDGEAFAEGMIAVIERQSDEDTFARQFGRYVVMLID